MGASTAFIWSAMTMILAREPPCFHRHAHLQMRVDAGPVRNPCACPCARCPGARVRVRRACRAQARVHVCTQVMQRTHSDSTMVRHRELLLVRTVCRARLNTVERSNPPCTHATLPRRLRRDPPWRVRTANHRRRRNEVRDKHNRGPAPSPQADGNLHLRKKTQVSPCSACACS